MNCGLHDAHIHGKHSVIGVIDPVRVLRFRVLLGVVVPLVLNLLGDMLSPVSLSGNIVRIHLLLVSLQNRFLQLQLGGIGKGEKGYCCTSSARLSR